jgi:UDP-galactopyranose mutase
MKRHGPMLVFSHLRWNSVYQRPQHLLTRLASAFGPVLFVEEPVHTNAIAPFWERTRVADGVEVLCPHTRSPEFGFSDAQCPDLMALLDDLAESEAGLNDPILWIYTPMALPFARRFRPALTVYDCMDELSAFAFAPPQLVAREADLMEAADLVFTGGPSLYRAKKGRHANVHCFPSSVDAAHFGRARKRGALTEPADQMGLPHPRLGFFGVLDERMDLHFLSALAAARPDWFIVMVGPVAKIDWASLPQAENLHYLGPRGYGDLPAYLSGWDVCLMPFAQNEATRFISPTKTLEYMAAERPIVSTPIADVAEPYGDIVYLADRPQTFVAACERALREADGPEGRRRAGLMRRVLSATSWDATAESMSRLMQDVLAREPARTAAAPAPSTQRRRPAMARLGGNP